LSSGDTDDAGAIARICGSTFPTIPRSPIERMPALEMGVPGRILPRQSPEIGGANVHAGFDTRA
jgi:hypothetical protein